MYWWNGDWNTVLCVTCMYVCVVCIYRDCVVQAQAADSAVMFITGDLMEGGVGQELRVVVEETLSELIQERRDKLESLRRQVVIQRQRKYWTRCVCVCVHCDTNDSSNTNARQMASYAESSTTCSGVYVWHPTPPPSSTVTKATRSTSTT